MRSSISILALSFFASVAACDQQDDDARTSSEQAKSDLPAAVEACQMAITNDYANDARTFHFSADEIKGQEADTLSPTDAKAAIAYAASTVGCDGAAVQFKHWGCAAADANHEPTISSVCHVTTNLGYFLVSATFPNGLAVTYSRFD